MDVWQTAFRDLPKKAGAEDATFVCIGEPERAKKGATPTLKPSSMPSLVTRLVSCCAPSKPPPDEELEDATTAAASPPRSRNFMRIPTSAKSPDVDPLSPEIVMEPSVSRENSRNSHTDPDDVREQKRLQRERKQALLLKQARKAQGGGQGGRGTAQGELRRRKRRAH